MTLKTTLPILLAGLVLLAGCRDDQSLTGPDTEANLTANAGDPFGAEDDPFRPDEARSRRLSRSIPGYGGFAFDRFGNINVYLTDPGNTQAVGAVQAALRPLLAEWRPGRRGRPAANPQVIVHQGQFTFLQLRDWRDRMTMPMLSIVGVTFTDLDEAKNRLGIGIDPARAGTARGFVVAKLAALGIPREAVLIEEFEPLVDAVGTASAMTAAIMSGSGTDLNERIRPIEGGTKIGTYLYKRGPFACTLGFNAVHRGVNVFITNAHCTNLIGTPGVVGDTGKYRANTFGQPDDANPGQFGYIGTEYADPNFYISSFATVTFEGGGTHDCNTDGTGYYCRRSDMAMIKAEVFKSEINYGYIARPIYDAYGMDAVGPTEISFFNPRFRIKGEQGHPVHDEMLDKVGISTGWTYGYVTKTCLDVARTHEGTSDPNPGNIAFRCQAYVSAGSRRGDSGAPVFRWEGNEVVLYGMVRGRNQHGFGYSSMDMIRLDLGVSLDPLQGDLTTF
jgi:hypothetical protein